MVDWEEGGVIGFGDRSPWSGGVRGAVSNEGRPNLGDRGSVIFVCDVAVVTFSTVNDIQTVLRNIAIVSFQTVVAGPLVVAVVSKRVGVLFDDAVGRGQLGLGVLWRVGYSIQRSDRDLVTTVIVVLSQDGTFQDVEVATVFGQLALDGLEAESGDSGHDHVLVGDQEVFGFFPTEL